ncbi:MAG: glycoside hydrolase family 3 N-terminal domain-containing protein, partial [Acutalibacteraceae bacterium]
MNEQNRSKHYETGKSLAKKLTVTELISQLIHSSKGIARLGIKPYVWWNEALHGVARAGIATVFPQAICMAASFDEKLIFTVAEAISTQARAKFNESQSNNDYGIYKGLTMWSPNINIFRDPRWGRGQETYGEDPYLTSVLGAAFIKGLQGDNPEYIKTAACAKHFAVHSGPEEDRHQI